MFNKYLKLSFLSRRLLIQSKLLFLGFARGSSAAAILDNGARAVNPARILSLQYGVSKGDTAWHGLIVHPRECTLELLAPFIELPLDLQDAVGIIPRAALVVLPARAAAIGV